MTSAPRKNRKPIEIEFPDGVDDETYLNLAAAIRAVADLVPVTNQMVIDPDLDDAYDEVDRFGPTRTAMANDGSRAPQT